MEYLVTQDSGYPISSPAPPTSLSSFRYSSPTSPPHSISLFSSDTVS
jgi:hypothetical protein